MTRSGDSQPTLDRLPIAASLIALVPVTLPRHRVSRSMGTGQMRERSLITLETLRHIAPRVRTPHADALDRHDLRDDTVRVLPFPPPDRDLCLVAGPLLAFRTPTLPGAAIRPAA